MSTEIDAKADTELVERVARRLIAELDLSCDPDDLRGWGHQGILEARQRFDATRGVRFSTFAYYRVHGAMMDGVRQQGWIKRRAYAKLKAYEALASVAEPQAEANSQAPSADSRERARQIDDTLAKVTAAFVLAAVGQDKEEDDHTPESLFSKEEDSAVVHAALSGLPANEKELLELVYFRDHTIEQAGKTLGLSKSWASRLHAKALERMRSALVVDTG